MAKRRQRASTSLSQLIPILWMGLALLAAAGVWLVWPEPETPAPAGGEGLSAGPTDTQAGAGPSATAPEQALAGVAPGKPYRPGVSDKELSAFLERLRAEQGDGAESQLTEQQIIDIMGTPTKNEPPIVGRKNGQVFSVKELRWEHHTPGKDYSTVVSIINGRFAGGVIGLEVTPLPSATPAAAPSPPPTQAGPSATAPSAPTGPLEDWVVGVWEGQLAASIGVPARTLRVEFRKTGDMVVLSEPRTPDNFEATWRVERTEANNLWILFDVTRLNGQPAQNPGRSILITRQTDDTFTSRAFQPPDAVEFRRVPGGR